jgi:hypothetical protein
LLDREILAARDAQLIRWMKAIRLRPAFAVATGAEPSTLNAA